MHETFFNEFLILLVVATVIAITFDRLKLPSTMGYLLAGVCIGPHGVSLISDPESIHLAAELGIVFLMLMIGIEFSMDKLRGLRAIAFIGGAGQLGVSILLGFGASILFDWSAAQGIVLGCVLALSSTAVVFKFLMDRGELETPYGRIAVAILVFQDLAFVPLMFLIHNLAPGQEGVWGSLGIAAMKAFTFLGIVYILARFVIRDLISWVAETKNREVFHLMVVVLCLGCAWLSGYFGLSMAIGAFIAGLVFANTEYGNQIGGEISGFRHVFVSIFFVSMGLLIDPIFIVQHAFLVFGLVTFVLVINFFTMFCIIMGFGYPPRIALTAAIILAQIGEFSFLLLEASRANGILDTFYYQLFITVTFITIFSTPFLFRIIPHVVRISEKIPLFGIAPKSSSKQEFEGLKKLKGHVILCGYGHVGRDLASAMTKEKIPFMVIEMSPRNANPAKETHDHVIFGDASNEAVLTKSGIAKAKVVIISFSDQANMINIMHVVQRLNPDVEIVVRARFENQVARLYELGADYVALEELEVDLEMNRLLYDIFGKSEKSKEAHIASIRARKELAIEQSIFKRLSR